MRQKHTALALSDYLKQNNCQVFIESLFKVKKNLLPQNHLDFKRKKIYGIVITSQNAVASLDKLAVCKNTKIFTVGKKTAQKIQDLGFKNIEISTQNSAENLAKIIANYPDIKGSIDIKIIYLRGQKINFDLANYLQNKKINCQEIIVYKTIKKNMLSEQLITNVKNNNFDSILIFSKNSLEIFFYLITKHNLLEYFTDSSLIVFSKKIADYAKELGIDSFFKKIMLFSDNEKLKNFYE